jgi:hypothetical protein
MIHRSSRDARGAPGFRIQGSGYSNRCSVNEVILVPIAWIKSRMRSGIKSKPVPAGGVRAAS